MSDDAYLEALERYQGYRDAAYALTWEELHSVVPSQCDLRLMPIDERALAYWQAIRDLGHLNDRGSFSWDSIYQQVRQTPRRFEVAIWDGNTLCGMACGMASRGHEYVTVKWLERFETDGSSGLKGLLAEVALTAADHYAVIIERAAVRLKNPLTGTEKLYRELGFVRVERRNSQLYLVRNV